MRPFKRPTKGLPKKFSRKRSKPLAEGSLAWYEAEWRRAAGKVSKELGKAFIKALAQLSYENKQLRKRVRALEVVGLAQLFGVVQIQGGIHSLDCDKREDPKKACTCKTQNEDVRRRLS